MASKPDRRQRRTAERQANAAQQSAGVAVAARDRYERAFRHLCHLVSLTNTGKTKGAIENLILTAIGLDRENPLTSPAAVAEAVDA